MDVQMVPASLRERLGVEATAGLAALLDTTRQEWTAEVIELAVDRFERRLTEEISGLRVDIANGFAGLRQEMTEGQAMLRREVSDGQAMLRKEMSDGQVMLRKEMSDGHAALRKDMADERVAIRRELAEGQGTLRKELSDGLAGVRQELATTRVELLKWSFLFWIGQVAAMTAILSFLLRR